jgi:hypothetical protein
LVKITVTPLTHERCKSPSSYAFTPADLAPLRDKKRFSRAFSRSRHNFHFVLDSRRLLQKGEEPFAPKLMPRTITIVLTQNVSQDQIPLTPWILAHRIGHAFQAGTGASQRVEQQVFDVLGEIIQTSVPAFLADTCFNFTGSTGICLNDKNWDVIANFLDTRCARQHRIINPLDIFAECVASYIIRGSVKLRQPEVVKVFRDNAYDFRHEDAPMRVFEAQPYDVFAMEQKINAILDSAFAGLCGKSLAF